MITRHARSPFIGDIRTGGGLWIYKSTVSLENLIIRNNHAQYDGGGIYMLANDNISQSSEDASFYINNV